MAKLAAVPFEKQSTEDQVKEQIRGFAEALRNKDLPKMMSYYSPDIVCFDIVPPLKYQGIEAYRKSWETGLSMMDQPIEVDARDIQVSASGDVAFCHSLNHMSFMSEGKKMEMWLRWTGCFREINGKWLLTHEHVSVPVDMETDKARYDLKP